MAAPWTSLAPAGRLRRWRSRPLSGDEAPADAHVAVRYRGRWFWIDGADAGSKRAFLIAQILLSLTDTSNSAASPLVTIPAG